MTRLKDAGAGRHAHRRRPPSRREGGRWGADAVIAQGDEGGGHTGPVPTTLLLPQVVDAVELAVLGAGGFFDGRGLVAALAYGAAGIAMGTRFLLTRESPVPDAVKEVYLATSVTDTVVTTRSTAPQRVIRTGRRPARAGGSSSRAVACRFGTPSPSARRGRAPGAVPRGLAMREGKELSWAQVVMAANAPR